MKKILSFFICALIVTTVAAQDNPETVKKKEQLAALSNRSNDHLLIQFGSANWAGKPDSIKTGGLSKSFNVYLMYDFPFKTNPKLSMAFGPGISTDHIVFKKTYVGIKDLTSTIQIKNQSDTNHFKKTKLATAYLEAPIELRYTTDPSKKGSIKMAIGVKIGTLMNAHTRNTKYENKSGGTLNDYVMKEASKRFFNKNRIVATARFGFGHWSLFGTYQLTSLFKDGFGPVVKPFSIGLTLSGL